MSAIGWQGRLDEAATADGVIEICNQYLAGLSAVEGAELPESCRLHRPLEAPDISPYALKLIRQIGVGNRARAPVLHGLTTFVAEAALRVAHIGIHIALGRFEERRPQAA